MSLRSGLPALQGGTAWKRGPRRGSSLCLPGLQSPLEKEQRTSTAGLRHVQARRGNPRKQIILILGNREGKRGGDTPGSSISAQCAQNWTGRGKIKATKKKHFKEIPLFGGDRGSQWSLSEGAEGKELLLLVIPLLLSQRGLIQWSCDDFGTGISDAAMLPAAAPAALVIGGV